MKDKTYKTYDEMTVRELDEWCQNNSGSILRDLDNNNIMMLIKESMPAKSSSSKVSRRYKMRILNLTYLTLGFATEGKIWQMCYDHENCTRRMSVGSNIGRVTASDVESYGQKEHDD